MIECEYAPAAFKFLNDTNDWYIEPFVTNQSLQRGKNLFVGKVARGAKENNRIGDRTAHSTGLAVCGFLDMAAELVSHGRQQFVRIFRQPARFEPPK